MNNQACKVRPEIVNVNSNEPVFYPFSIKTSKCSGSCNNINDPYAEICVPNVVKDLNVKVFNLISRTNKTRHIKQHKTCKCKCRLDTSLCDNRQRWNSDKCRCECKKLINKGVCDEGYAWNPSNCQCECNKSCEYGEYLHYETANVEKGYYINQLNNVMKILKKQVQLKLIWQSANVNLAYCTLCYFQYFLQSILEQVLILFTINT